MQSQKIQPLLHLLSIEVLASGRKRGGLLLGPALHPYYSKQIPQVPFIPLFIRFILGNILHNKSKNA